jgi:hypothetical protein
MLTITVASHRVGLTLANGMDQPRAFSANIRWATAGWLGQGALAAWSGGFAASRSGPIAFDLASTPRGTESTRQLRFAISKNNKPPSAMPTGQRTKGLVSSSIRQSSVLRRNWSRVNAAGHNQLLHTRPALHDLEEQPAGEREADEPGNEECFDVRHQTGLLASATMAQPDEPAEVVLVICRYTCWRQHVGHCCNPGRKSRSGSEKV